MVLENTVQYYIHNNRIEGIRTDIIVAWVHKTLHGEIKISRYQTPFSSDKKRHSGGIKQ